MAKTEEKGEIEHSSLRTAFIRVSAINNTTKEGRVEYTLSDIENIMSNWSRSATLTYWLIEHDETETQEEVKEEKKSKEAEKEFIPEGKVQFNSPMPFPNIKKKFRYGDIEPAKNMVRAIQYLVHLNHPSKKQYSWESIITNGELEKYKKVVKEITLNEVIENIDAGIITEINLYDHVTAVMYSHCKSKIDNAFKYCREREFLNKNRDIDVILMVGDSATGKTLFAKRYCERTNSTFGVSSASNDSMQDYKGEQVFILDDLRDDSFEFHNLLKTLDNHTNSSIKSRFTNKMFTGKTIIITSTVPIEDWYKNLTKEDKKQLYRRIKSKFVFDDKWITIGRTENIISLEDKRRKANTLKVFEDMGLKIEKVSSDDIEESESVMRHNAIDDELQSKLGKF